MYRRLFSSRLAIYWLVLSIVIKVYLRAALLAISLGGTAVYFCRYIRDPLVVVSKGAAEDKGNWIASILAEGSQSTQTASMWILLIVCSAGLAIIAFGGRDGDRRESLKEQNRNVSQSRK